MQNINQNKDNATNQKEKDNKQYFEILQKISENKILMRETEEKQLRFSISSSVNEENIKQLI